MRYTIAVLGATTIVCAIAVGDRLHAEPQYRVSPPCTPIARVLQGNSTTSAGNLICTGGEAKISPAARILCFSTGEVLSGFELSRCLASSRSLRNSSRPCSTDGSICPKPKGPTDIDGPMILYPYSSTLLDNKPTFRWREVPGAMSYTVRVSGPGVSWRKTLEQTTTTLTYPADVPALQYGSAYKVSVIANRSDSYFNAADTVFTLLDSVTATNVTDTINQVRQLSLSEDDVAVDIDAVFSAHGLWTQAINNLTTRVSAGSQDPRVFRLLGDRFLEIGLPTYAEKNYIKAQELAKKRGDFSELQKISEGLQAIKLTRS